MGVLRFDAFTLDVSRRAIMRGGEQLSLRPQSFDVLHYLAEHPGRLLSKKELVEKFWDPKRAKDDSLVACIKDIRDVLGDTGHDLIKTVPRRGYVFTPKVSGLALPSVTMSQAHSDASPPAIPIAQKRHTEPLTAALPARGRQAAIAASILIIVLLVGGWLLREAIRPDRPAELTMMPVPSIAVLPFTAVGEERDQADAAALTDDITTELSRTPRGYRLRIRAAPGYKLSVEHPRRAGRELGVRYLVLGSIHRKGDGRHVNVQLIEAESGRQVWAEPFIHATGEAGAQNHMGVRIARLVQHQILRAEVRLPLPVQPEANHFVMLGRALMSGERGVDANRQAIAFFDKARALDPNSVPALQGYARTRVNQVLNRWVPKEQGEALLTEAGEAIKLAVSLDPREPGLHVLRGAYLRAMGKDAEAVAAFEHAIYLNANYPLAYAELGRAKIEIGLASETVKHVEEAIRLSPTEPYLAAWYYWAGMAEAHVERYKSATSWLLKARQANRAYPNTVPWLAIAYAGLGEWEEARAYLEEHRSNWPQFSLSRWNQGFPSRHPVVAAQRERIAKILRELGAPDGEMRTGAAR